MPKTIAVAGAGLLGRLLALALSQQNYKVSLYDQDDKDGKGSCGYTGAGMLAPVSELETADPLIAALGFDSLPLWKQTLKKMSEPVFFQQAGTLLVAYGSDKPELYRFAQTLKSKLNNQVLLKAPIQNAIVMAPAAQKIGLEAYTSQQVEKMWLDANAIQMLEPELGGRFQSGLHLVGEGQVDNRQLLSTLNRELEKIGVAWFPNHKIKVVKPHFLDGQYFEWVLDCRGLGTRPDWNAIRGVRGEIIRVYAQEVKLTRPIRLMHPRYPLYITPRQDNHYIIGATSLESDDVTPMTVQSALELLSAAFAIHSGFAEASILEMGVNLRPTLPTHLPEIQTLPGLIRINGLSRHGFLIGPKLVDLVCNFLSGKPIEEHYSRLFKNNLTHCVSEREHSAYAIGY